MTDDAAYDVDFRATPEAYEVGTGEEGVFKVQPYKGELLPLWGIATLEDAETGAAAIYEQFLAYKRQDEFVGMDLARKYLQMGWTRSLRYAKYPGGKKYDDDGTERDPQQWCDEEKYRISQVYRDYLDRVQDDEEYRRQKAAWTDSRG